MLLSLSHEKGPYPVPPDFAKSVKAMGVGLVRYMPQWPLVEPQRGEYKWDAVDQSIDAITAAGLQVCLNPYFFPAWVTEGKAVMTEYTCDCSHPNFPFTGMIHAPVTGPDGLCTDPNCRKPNPLPAPAYCWDPITIDDSGVYEFGRALAQRYGSRVTWWSAWNEPGIRVYWITPKDEYGHPTFQRFANQVVIPWTKGVREVLPDAKFIGLQADSSGLCGDLLEIERDEAKMHLFDVIGIHPYPDGRDPDPTIAAINRTKDDFLPIIEPYRDGREVWVTEVGSVEPAKFMRGVQQLGINSVNFHDVTQWFASGSISPVTSLPTDAAKGYQPGDRYREMQAYMFPRRRRPGQEV